jgi:hypothetical protein
MKNWISLLFLIVFAASGWAQPVLRNPFTTNTVPTNATIQTRLKITEPAATYPASVSLDDKWVLYKNRTTSVFALEWLDSGAIPFYADSGTVYFPLAVQIPTGAGADKVLTSDGSGNASWQGAPAPMTLDSSFAIEYFDDYATGSNGLSLSGGYGFNANGYVDGNYSIVTRTNVEGRTENRLQLNTGQYGRPMPWGNKWKRVRVGVLWRVAGTATFTNICALGICFGTNAMWPSANASNWFGYYYGANSTPVTPTSFNYSNINPAVDWTFYHVPIIRAGTKTNGTYVERTVSNTVDGGIGADPVNLTWAQLEVVRSFWSTTNSYTMNAKGATELDSETTAR